MTRKSHNERVLELLLAHQGNWIERPYRTLSVMWHSRVAELRRKGHVIETRRVKDGDEVDYQYRIVEQA